MEVSPNKQETAVAFSENRFTGYPMAAPFAGYNPYPPTVVAAPAYGATPMYAAGYGTLLFVC
jgi:hypothetical protein